MQVPKSRVPPDPTNSRFPKARLGKASGSRGVLSDRDRPFVYLMIFLFTLLMALTEWLPENVLTQNPWLDNLVEKVAAVAPAVNNFRRLSQFPEVAATVYAFEITLLPVLVAYFLICSPFRIRIEKPGKMLLWVVGACAFTAGNTYWVFASVPGEGPTQIRWARNIWEMTSDQFTFCFMGTLFLIVIPLLLAGTFSYITITLKVLFPYTFSKKMKRKNSDD